MYERRRQRHRASAAAHPARRRGPKDLLDLHAERRDPVRAELDDDNIRYQIVTFLIAGHETTSGLLSFALYLLLQNPEVMAKARAEVDRVLRRR